jgi:hypothetical protein
MDEWTSIHTGLLWERMKLLSSHMAAERTPRRQEQEFKVALKRGILLV